MTSAVVCARTGRKWKKILDSSPSPPGIHGRLPENRTRAPGLVLAGKKAAEEVIA